MKLEETQERLLTVLSATNISRTEQGFLFALIRNGTELTGTELSLAELAVAANMSRKTVYRMKLSLEAKGIISVERGIGQGMKNRYFINYGMLNYEGDSRWN